MNPVWKRVQEVGLRGLEPPTHGLGNRVEVFIPSCLCLW